MVDGVERALDIGVVSRGQDALKFAFDRPDSDGERQLLGFEVVGTNVRVVQDGVSTLQLPPTPYRRTLSSAERAMDAADTMRRALSSVDTPMSLAYDLVLDDAHIGDVAIDMTPTSLHGVPVWRVEEMSARRGGAAVVRQRSTYWMQPDGRWIRGTIVNDTPSDQSTIHFMRSMTPQRARVVTTLPDGRRREAEVSAHDRSIYGWAPLLVMLRDAPAQMMRERVRWIVPGFHPRFAPAPKAGSGKLPGSLSDVTIDIEHARAAEEQIRVRTRWGWQGNLSIDPTTRTLKGLRGTRPRSSWVPRGQGGKAPTWFDDVEVNPMTPRQAFVRFGRGYHMADRALLARAFNWQSMLNHEIAKGVWPEGADLSQFRRAWIDEFIKRSKHRTKADCDDLLMQIFLTMTVTKHDDGSVTFASIPVYGGHRYRIGQGVKGAGYQILAVD